MQEMVTLAWELSSLITIHDRVISLASWLSVNVNFHHCSLADKEVGPRMAKLALAVVHQIYEIWNCIIFVI